MLLPGPLKNLLRGKRAGPDASAPSGVSGNSAAPAPPAPRAAFPTRRSGQDETVSTRPSRGLEEFFSYIRGQSGLTILDLGGATQQNVTFITNLGHRLYSEDFLAILRETFGQDAPTDQSNAGQVEYFLRQALDYEEGKFDG